MTAGCSSALRISLAVLCDPGDNIIAPCPCYSLYMCLAGGQGITIKFYQLLVSLLCVEHNLLDQP